MSFHDQDQNFIKPINSLENDESHQKQKLYNKELSQHTGNATKCQKSMIYVGRKVSADPGNECTNRLNIKFGLEESSDCFNSNTPLQMKNLYSQKNQKTFSNKNIYSMANFSQKLVNDDLLYVVFENLYGENSCFLNVILHLLYFFPSVFDFVTNIYQHNLNMFQINNNINNHSFEFFIFLLGNILSQYKYTIQFRK